MFPTWVIPIAIFFLLLPASFALYQRGAYRQPSVRVAIRIIGVLALLAGVWLYLRVPSR